MLHSTTTDREVTVMSVSTLSALDRLIATLIVWAGPDYLWNNGPRPGHKPTSNVKRGLQAYLLNLTGHECTFCGTSVQTSDPRALNAAELCHIVSRGPERRGWLAGNIAIGCKACNDVQKASGPIVDVSATVHPIVTEWPTVPVLNRMGAAVKASR